jgi:sialidase-1
MLLHAGLALPLAGKALAEGAEEPVRTDLWRAGQEGYAIYRIPGLVRTARGTLLAYCEARKTGASDWDQIDVMLRRSTDGGRTWEPSRRIVEPPDVPRNPVARRRPGDASVTVNNPVAIADRKRGLVHFLFCVEYAHCFYMRSQDDGKTWSAPVNITPAFEAFRPEYDWKVLATGPGHGIQLRSGRLLVPAWLSLGTGGGAHRPSCVATIYSDDGGRSWRRGAIVANNPNPANPSETAAVELSDGRVMLNLRHEGPEKRRAVTVSPDGAGGWSPLRFDPALPEPVCMGTLARLSGRPRKNRILFANPDNPVDRTRRNLTVRLSYDDGQTWPVSRSLEPGMSAYSDLAAGRDGWIYCLYERGVLPEAPGRTAALTLARFRLEWLTEGRDRWEE